MLFQNHDSSWYTVGYYQLAELAAAFAERLRLFTVFGRITPQSLPSGAFRIPSERVPEFRVEGPIVGGKGIWNYFKASFALIHKLRFVNVQHDVTWFMMPSLAGLLGLLFTPRTGVRVAQLVGEWTMPMRAQHPYLAAIAVPLLDRLTTLALARADIAVFVSEYLRDKFGRRLSNQVMIANESRLQRWMIKEVDRSQLHNPLRVLFVGRLVPEKDVQFLLEATALLKRDLPLELWVVGDGPYRERLHHLARKFAIVENIKWFGWITWGESLFTLMHEADVLVMPSLLEGVGMVHFEAMSQSLPVVASRVGGIPEVVKDSISGLLIEPGSSHPIARAIRQLATDSALRTRIVAGGLQVAKAHTAELQTGRVIDTICLMTHTRVRPKSDAYVS